MGSKLVKLGMQRLLCVCLSEFKWALLKFGSDALVSPIDAPTSGAWYSSYICNKRRTFPSALFTLAETHRRRPRTRTRASNSKNVNIMFIMRIWQKCVLAIKIWGFSVCDKCAAILSGSKTQDVVSVYPPWPRSDRGCFCPTPHTVCAYFWPISAAFAKL